MQASNSSQAFKGEVARKAELSKSLQVGGTCLPANLDKSKARNENRRACEGAPALAALEVLIRKKSNEIACNC